MGDTRNPFSADYNAEEVIEQQDTHIVRLTCERDEVRAEVKRLRECLESWLDQAKCEDAPALLAETARVLGREAKTAPEPEAPRLAEVERLRERVTELEALENCIAYVSYATHGMCVALRRSEGDYLLDVYTQYQSDPKAWRMVKRYQRITEAFGKLRELGLWPV